jgi:RHS repeat-associated protein
LKPAGTVVYGYDNTGRTSTVTYPMAAPFGSGSYPAGATTFTYAFDSMGRPTGLTDSNSWAWAKNAQYDYAGRPIGMQYLVAAGAWTTGYLGYNVNSQLALMKWSGSGPVGGLIQYNYSATQNNGQITQAVDNVSGETITYQYDQLRRLTSAASTPIAGTTPTAWTQTFQYDGFGNLTAKVLNGTTTAIAVNPTTNHLSSAYYDLNGNMTSGAGATWAYDVANRVSSATEVSGGTEYYYYAPDNKRIYRLEAGGITEEWTSYGARGERLGVYSLGVSGGFTPLRTNVSFAGTLILDLNNAAYSDRIGSNRASGARFYPYGDEITSTGDDREKFGTYLRDHFTGFDYADQRYYASSYGRFNSPDSVGAQAGDPVSWNRYSYTGGDPVNRLDPHGMYWVYSSSLGWCSTLDLDSWCSNGGGSGCSGISPDAMLSLVLSGDAGECGWGGGMTDSSTLYEQIIPAQAAAPAPPAPPPPPAPCLNWCLMPAAESQALFDLADKPGCASDFNGHDPAVVLVDMIAGLGFGNVSFDALKPDRAANTQLNELRIGSIFRRKTVRTATIIINTITAPGFIFWNDGRANYNAVTLLHELGHVFDWEFGQNSTSIVYDALPDGSPDPVAETHNATAMAACGP